MSRFKYLGGAVSYESEYDIRKKINKFRDICSTIHRNLRNKTKHRTRINFYKTIPIPTLIYASEAWVMSRKESDKIRVLKCCFVYNIFNYTLEDRLKNEDVTAKLEVKDIN